MGRRVPPLLRTSIRRWFDSGPSPCRSITSTSRAIFSFETRPSFTPAVVSPFVLSEGFSTFPPLRIPCRRFSSDTASSDGSQDAIIIESEDDFDNSLKKVQDGALPAIFYFSAAWCGPCKFLSPVVNQVSKMYPPCVTFKIDIDMEGMQTRLSELGISAVPTLNFYNGGKQVATVVGADVQKIKEIMDKFFK